jgi:hypothetical protein
MSRFLACLLTVMVAINAGDRCVHSHEHDTTAIVCGDHGHDHCRDSCSQEPCKHVCVMSPAPQAVHSPIMKTLECASLAPTLRHFYFDDLVVKVRTILESGISFDPCCFINPILRC